MDYTQAVSGELLALANPVQAKLLARFFKTGKGQYGEGDIFLGIIVPQERQVAKKYYRNISLAEVAKLLESDYHEFRFTALVMLVNKFERAAEPDRKEIFEFYLKHTGRINNWDLVDLTCPKIVGRYLLDKPREVLYKLAASPSLWERRIAIISTMIFINAGDYADSLSISELLLKDKHDLIHKAVGWMLREIYKHNPQVAEKFLDKHIKDIPRTALRYAIEKMPETRRKQYLLKK